MHNGGRDTLAENGSKFFGLDVFNGLNRGCMSFFIDEKLSDQMLIIIAYFMF